MPPLARLRPPFSLTPLGTAGSVAFGSTTTAAGLNAVGIGAGVFVLLYGLVSAVACFWYAALSPVAWAAEASLAAVRAVALTAGSSPKLTKRGSVKY